MSASKYINLLPQEYANEQVKREKFYKVQLIGVSAILLLVFLSSLTFALRLLQNQNIQKLNFDLTNTELKINSFKNREVSVVVLKNRLTTISQYVGVESKATQTYNLISSLIPPSVLLNAISIDRSNITVLSIATSDGAGLDTFLANLVDKNTNQGLISKFNVDSFIRGRDGMYRITLKIYPN